MSPLIGKMIIFLVLMILGYVCARLRLIGSEFTRDASKMTMNIFMSATIFNAVLSNSGAISGGSMVNALLVMSLVQLLCYVTAWIFVMVSRPKAGSRGMDFLLAAVTNNMFLGLPVAQMLYGETGVLYLTLGNLGFNVLIYTWGMFELCSGEGKKPTIKDILSVPLMVTVAAAILALMNVSVPAVVNDLLSTLGGATMPLSMIVIGATLSSVSLADAFRKWRIYIVSFVRLVAAPIITWLLLRLFVGDPVLLGTAVIVAACPSGVMVTILSIQKGKDPVYTSEAILVCTLLSLITIPAITGILL